VDPPSHSKLIFAEILTSAGTQVQQIECFAISVKGGSEGVLSDVGIHLEAIGRRLSMRSSKEIKNISCKSA
jgi:hypothetical protein